MIGVAVIALACGGIAWLTRGACLDARVINSTGSTITDVRITYPGSTRSLGDLSPWQAYKFGRHAYGWTPVTVSYLDGRGKRVGAMQWIGVDLRRPVRADGDSGQAVINIEPTALAAQRRHWVSLIRDD
jgi:hypothetical protein